MPKLQNAPGLDPKGTYKATPLVGAGMYGLALVEPPAASAEAPSEDYVVKLDPVLCRQLRSLSKSKVKPRPSLRSLVEDCIKAQISAKLAEK